MFVSVLWVPVGARNVADEGVGLFSKPSEGSLSASRSLSPPGLSLKGTYYENNTSWGFWELIWVSGAPTHTQTLKKVCT